MTEPFWRNVLAQKTFNSVAGRIVQSEAKKKLGALDKKLPLDLLADVYRFYLKEAAYELWPLTKKTRDEHAPTLVTVLKKEKALPASFLVAGYEQGDAVGLRRAGDFMGFVARTTNVPGTLKSLAKHWAKLEVEPLAAAAAAALGQHLKNEPSETLVFFALIYVVARSEPGHPVIGDLKRAFEKWGDEYGTLDRTLTAAAKG